MSDVNAYWLIFAINRGARIHDVVVAEGNHLPYALCEELIAEGLSIRCRRPYRVERDLVETVLEEGGRMSIYGISRRNMQQSQKNLRSLMFGNA